MILVEEYPHRRFQDAFFHACDLAGSAPSIMHRTSHSFAVMTLVASGMGIGLTPFTLALPWRGTVEFRPLAREAFAVPQFLVWRSRNSNSVVAAFIEMARSKEAARPSQVNAPVD